MIAFDCIKCRRLGVDCEGYIPELPGENEFTELPCLEPEEESEEELEEKRSGQTGLCHFRMPHDIHVNGAVREERGPT